MINRRDSIEDADPIQHRSAQPMSDFDRALVLKTQLERQRRQLVDKIAAYPTPIPGCDVQFNYLLRERGDISRAINRLTSLLSQQEGSTEALVSLLEQLEIDSE